MIVVICFDWSGRSGVLCIAVIFMIGLIRTDESERVTLLRSRMIKQ